MAESMKTSQVQQFTGEWNKVVAEQVTRVEAGVTELAKLVAMTLAQAVTSLGEAGRIAKESATFIEKASAEWRKLFLDTTRRAAAILAVEMV